MNKFLDIVPEVAAAIAGGQAVVSLEATIIAHGMPYPQNLAMARTVEGIVRAGGAVPATIAILGGRLKVGLGAAELEQLARGQGIAKAGSTGQVDQPQVHFELRQGQKPVDPTPFMERM